MLRIQAHVANHTEFNLKYMRIHVRIRGLIVCVSSYVLYETEGERERETACAFYYLMHF
jgi:hypothetical protein